MIQYKWPGLSRNIFSEKRLFVIFLTLSLYWISTAEAQHPASFVVNGRRLTTDSFDRQVNSIIHDVGVPGVSLAVIDHNKVVFSNVYGYKDLENLVKVDDSTVFEAASLSKTFLVYVVDKLLDEGKLDLNKPMYQYLENPRLAHDPRYKLITPRMILSHSSGIENWQWLNNPDTLEIVANPGERFVYSGEGFQYLAAVVDTILQKPYEQYIREMVLEPLHLRNTYPRYTDNGNFPTDYATGYDNFGKKFSKWKNLGTVPASGMHLVARDYANLIVSIFDGKHLSGYRIKSIYQPVIPLNQDDSNLYFGLGLAVQYSPTDTIVFHNGSNDGFKSMMWYSIVHKCGLVILTNGDRENVMEKKICEISVNFNLDSYFKNDDYDQYPSNACDLFKIYRQEDSAAMFIRIAELRKKGQLDVRTLNELGQIFSGNSKTIARKLLEENVQLFPESSIAFYSLGKFHMSVKEYESAYADFKKAKELNYDRFKINAALNNCTARLNESKK